MQAFTQGSPLENCNLNESLRGYANLLKNQTKCLTEIVCNKKFQKITDQEAHSQTLECVGKFIKKEINFLKLYD